MAEYVSFPQMNFLLDPPSGGEEQPDGSSLIDGVKVSSLPVFTDNTQFISCWELSVDELLEVVRTRRLYLFVLGHGHPPVHITGINPFNGPPGEFIPADDAPPDPPKAA